MTEVCIGSRIIVVGCPGSGKSTLSRKLRDITGLPLFHLDNIWWKANGTHVTREEFDIRLAEVIGGESWIIDGNYSRTLEVRIKACDTLIFLDFDEDVCMSGITERVGKKHSDIPWIERSVSPELAETVRGYRGEQRPKLIGLLEKYGDMNIIIFGTRREADEWLETIARK